jgi:hypothetical protein
MVLGFDFDRLRSGPFEGPAIVKPGFAGGYLFGTFGKISSALSFL